MPPNPKSKIENHKSEIILLAVTGMSPAVLTETVWALAFPADKDMPTIIPDRVITLTTTVGRDAIAAQLFGADCIWQKFREAVLGPRHKNDSRLCFGTTGDCVKVITRKVGGKPLELKDVSTEAENTAVADFITDELWGHVEKPGTRLIASISGGYKTMSALLFAGMSLLGRKDDLITHVLVNTPYDTAFLTPRFFYPEQPQQELKDRDGKVYLAREAQLRLGFVPFVPLHDLLEKYKKPRSYSDLVERCRGNLDRRLRQPVKLRLWVSKRQVAVNDALFRLAPQPFLFLLFLAERARSGAPALGKYSEALAPLGEFAGDLQTQWERRGIAWAAPGKKILPKDFQVAVKNWDDTPIRTKLLYEIGAHLRRTPGTAALEPRLPQPGCCALDLPPEDIEILD
jgi:CRISPR-associated protein (TIGR02584 family)